MLALLTRDASDPRLRLHFTVRNAELPTHAGQISFPGGKAEDSDVDEIATALRETHEELGVRIERDDVVGMLDDVPTPTRFVITPVVALIEQPLTLLPNAREVAAIFSAPIDELRDPKLYTSSGTRQFLGIDFTMHEYQWQEHRIWGATARMVSQLLALTA